MRYLATSFCLVLSIASSGQSFFELADRFFSQYVENGLVKYDELDEDRSTLDHLVKEIGDYQVQDVSDQERKAFYINTYNILVISHILDHFPTEGPMTIPGFFDKLKSKVAGDYLTLDEIEEERLFKAFPDPRLHFVLVCAAKGCPPLAPFSFQPELLNNQLEQRAEYVLNFPTFIRVNNTSVQISRIFEWYKDDFFNENGSVFEYINHFHRQDLKGKVLEFYDYDWSLNRY